MPQFRVTSPSGKVYNVNAPEGATKEQALAMVQRRESQGSAPKPQSWGDLGRDILGVSNPVSAISDLVTGRQNRLTAGLAQGAADVGDHLASKLQGAYNAAAGVVGLPQSHSADTPAFTKTANKLGPGSAPTKTAGSLAAQAFLMKNLPGGAAAQGGASSLLMSDSKDPAGLVIDTLLGTAGAHLTNKAIQGVSGMITPKIGEAARYLYDKGISMTPGQVIPAFKSAEDKLMSRPGIGDVIEAGRKRSFQDFNRVATQETLDPIGVKLPTNVEGRKAVAWAGNKLSSEYENLIPKLTLAPDTQLAQDIAAVHTATRNGDLTPAGVKQFDSIIRNQVAPFLNGSRPLTGQQYRAIEKRLSEKIALFGKQQGADNQVLADSFKGIQGAFQSALQRSNPAHAEQLGALNDGWARLVRVEGASTAARGAMFAPGQFWTSMRSADASTRHRAVGRGQALMQDLADNAVQTLPSSYPDSGTAGRGQMNPFNPLYWYGKAQGLAYGPGTQKLITDAAMAPRPKSAQTISGLLNVLPAGQIGAAGAGLLSGGW